MSWVKERFDSEPVAILAVVQTGVTMLALFGVDITKEQTAGVVAFSAAVLTVVARRKVSPS